MTDLIRWRKGEDWGLTQMRREMDRLMIESAIRFRIDDLFREAGIVIAFPQRDVHLDTQRPLELRIVDVERGSEIQEA
jgi:small-conductance mechanosensitive channel